MRAGWRAGLAAVLAMTMLVATAVGQAAAGDWSERVVGENQLLGISCPTASRCVAVGAGNTVVSSNDPTAGAAGWNRINVGAGEQTTWGHYSPGRAIRAVDCPTAGFCVGVSYEGFVYTSTNPTGGPGAWSTADLTPEGPNIHMYGVDCPATNLCVAVGTEGELLTSTDPGGGAGAWTLAQLPESVRLRGVSCASANLCVAVGEEGVVVSSTRPLGGAAAWGVTQLPGAAIDRLLLGVGCSGLRLCVTGNAVNTLFVSTSPTGPAGAWSAAQGKGTVQITDVDCPSPTRCAAIDNNGDVLTSTDPTGGAGAWTFQNLLTYTQGEKDVLNPNALFGVSCPSLSLCAVAATKGKIFTSTNPFEPPPANPQPKPKKHRKHKGPKRPRALIALSPPPGIEIPRGRAKVRFRFFAANHASVRGFVCKLDRHDYKPCKSPKTYRVGFGKHLFKVRAVGWTGYRGRAAYDPFQVCHPTELGNCIRSSNGNGPSLGKSRGRLPLRRLRARVSRGRCVGRARERSADVLTGRATTSSPSPSRNWLPASGWSWRSCRSGRSSGPWLWG